MQPESNKQLVGLPISQRISQTVVCLRERRCSNNAVKVLFLFRTVEDPALFLCPRAYFTLVTETEAETETQTEGMFRASTSKKKGGRSINGRSIGAKTERTKRCRFLPALFCFCQIVSLPSQGKEK